MHEVAVTPSSALLSRSHIFISQNAAPHPGTKPRQLPPLSCPPRRLRALASAPLPAQPDLASGARWHFTAPQSASSWPFISIPCSSVPP